MRGIAGGLQFLLIDRLRVALAEEIAEQLRTDLVAILLANDRHRRLARTESFEARVTGDLLEPILELARHLCGGYGNLDATLEIRNGANGYLHDLSLTVLLRSKSGAKGETRTLKGYPAGT